jgi:hypothetical protein
MSKYGVFITSAANAKFSKYSPEERVLQTLDTVESVRKRIPNAFICMTECGVPGVDKATQEQLSADVDVFVNLSKDPNVNWIQNNIQHQDTVKNLTELVVVSKFFKLAKEKQWFADCDRIFKVSGRYWLTDNFDINRYEQADAKGKYVVSKKMLSQFPKDYVGQSLQYMLRVYSLDIALLDDFSARLSIMTNHMQERVNAGGYIDIEHLFCKFLPKDLTLEIARTGVAGNIAPNGQFIEN